LWQFWLLIVGCTVDDLLLLQFIYCCGCGCGYYGHLLWQFWLLIVDFLVVAVVA